jgi:YgiT-type zinc finger domain-containing protein
MNKREEICKHKNFTVIQREETYPVLGENTTIIANVKVCDDCGEDVFDFELDEENLKRAFKKYKRNHALMTAEEICALRKNTISAKEHWLHLYAVLRLLWLDMKMVIFRTTRIIILCECS